jgi:hypothetical protein
MDNKRPHDNHSSNRHQAFDASLLLGNSMNFVVGQNAPGVRAGKNPQRSIRGSRIV